MNVKVAGAGGFNAAREALSLARANGLGAFLSSTLDGPWGIAAALQLAASEDVKLACGLATLELFDSPIARALPAPRNGTLKVPPGPGLGVERRARGACGCGCRGARPLVVVAFVADLAADLAAGPLRAVDVRVRHADADRLHELLELARARCPGPPGRSRPPAVIVPLHGARLRARRLAAVRRTGTRSRRRSSPAARGGCGRTETLPSRSLVGQLVVDLACAAIDRRPRTCRTAAVETAGISS